MTTLDYSDGQQTPDLTTEDRRTRETEPAGTPKRRIDDTFFNRLRWPVFLLLWFIGGLSVLGYLVKLAGS